jgi:hypothetical protein
MTRSQLFVVPGNHDIARNTNQPAWAALRDASQQGGAGLSRWMAGGETPFGCTDAWRGELLARQQNYRDWLTRYWPERQSGDHHPLGYRMIMDVGGRLALHIVGLGSAWLAGDEENTVILQLTGDQIARHLTEDDGGKLDGVKIVLLHHPLSELGDEKNARRLMAKYGVDLLLHWHVHDPDYRRWQYPNHAQSDGRDAKAISADCVQSFWVKFKRAEFRGLRLPEA